MRALIMPAFVLLVACGGGSGPQADASKTPAQVQQQADAADKTALEQTIQQYKSAIASLEGEKVDLEKQIKDLGSQALDGLLGGEGKTEEVGQGVAELEQQVKDIVAQLDGLATRLKIYVDELASRA